MSRVKDIYGIIKLYRERKVKNDAYLSFSQCHRSQCNRDLYLSLSTFMYHVYTEIQKLSR